MRPQLVINPKSDGEFVAQVHVRFEQAVGTTTELQRSLRDQYPSVVVRERTLDGESYAVWYVYRDGAWVPDLAPEARTTPR